MKTINTFTKAQNARIKAMGAKFAGVIKISPEEDRKMKLYEQLVESKSLRNAFLKRAIECLS